MPWVTRSCGGNRSRSMPASSAVPLAGSAPINARMRVVLPAPLRPTSPHISPALSSSEALRMIGMAPIETSRFAILSMSAVWRTKVKLRPADQLLNARIFQRRDRRPVGDHRAVVEREYAIGITLDDVHIVLD